MRLAATRVQFACDTGDKLFSGVNDTGENPCHGEITEKLQFFVGVNDTAKKLFTGVNDTVDKLFSGVNHTGN